MPSSVIGIAVLLVPVVGTWAALGLSARSFTVAQPGSSAEYWEHLCGVQLPSFQGHHRYSYSGEPLPAVNGSLYYYDQMHHEQLLYFVPVERVLADVQAVQTALVDVKREVPASCRKDGLDLCRLYWSGSGKRGVCVASFQTLSALPSSVMDLELLRATALERSVSADTREGNDRAFRERLQRSERAWLTFAFEAIYLTAWWVFVAWGVFRIRPLLSWRWRVVFAPWLLFLPYFLGYAPMTFTFGPTGGFVYPDYLVLAGLPLQLVPCTSADRFVGQFLPRPLSTLSQLPGAPLAVYRGMCVGPVSSLVGGLVLVALASAIVMVVRQTATRRARREAT